MSRLIEDRVGRRARVYGEERAVLVELQLPRDRSDLTARDERDELVSLSETAGLQVLRWVVQKRDRPDPAHFIGAGKAEEIGKFVHTLETDVVIFNDELTPAQARNLEERIGCKIIDRSQLIMDIFAQRAKSKEAQLQVQLAQLEYLLPRLRGWGAALEQFGGGIGMRGPGETRLETDRRKVVRNIHRIKKRLNKARIERQIQRKRRIKNRIPVVALVGYTNSGKSTLLNRLSGADAFVEDKLFATLDTLTRQVSLPDGRRIVLIDTVGFIRRLPHQLIPAFSATLESIQDADLVIHVVDVSHPEWSDHWRTVNRTLNQEIFTDKNPPTLVALNKIDRLSAEALPARLARAQAEIEDPVAISARNGTHLDRLLVKIAELLGDQVCHARFTIPYAQSRLIGTIHRVGEVSKQRYEAEAIVVEATMEKSRLRQFEGQDGVRIEPLSESANR
ncbi:MAG: GTPase HflX [Candidatus Bipolaricaulia bacterium]